MSSENKALSQIIEALGNTESKNTVATFMSVTHKRYQSN